MPFDLIKILSFVSVSISEIINENANEIFKYILLYYLFDQLEYKSMKI